MQVYAILKLFPYFFLFTTDTNYRGAPAPKKCPSIAIMQASDDNILNKALVTRIFICFSLPCLSIFSDQLRIHLISFVAQIMLKGGKVGYVKFGSEEG